MHTLLTSAGARGQRPTQRKTDSNDFPRPKPAVVFRERFMAAPHEEGCCEKNITITHFVVFKGLLMPKHDVGVERDTACSRRYGRE